MRTIMLEGGKCICYSCGKELEKPPREERREKLFAQLCAIKDNDTAARAFHYHRENEEHFDKQTTLWMPRMGLHIPDVAHVVVDGIQLSLEPGVKPDAMDDDHLDTIMAHIKHIIVKTLDGTQAKEADDFQELLHAGKIQPHPYDPAWCPEHPTVEELYPWGYVRHEDGTVEANPFCNES